MFIGLEGFDRFVEVHGFVECEIHRHNFRLSLFRIIKLFQYCFSFTAKFLEAGNLMVFDFVGVAPKAFFEAFGCQIDCSVNIFVFLGDDDSVFILEVDDKLGAESFFSVACVARDYDIGRNDIEVVFVQSVESGFNVVFDRLSQFEMSSCDAAIHNGILCFNVYHEGTTTLMVN